MRRVRFFSLRLSALIAIPFFAAGCISTQGGRVSNPFDKTAAKSASLFMQSVVLAKGGRANAIIVTGKNPPIAEQTAIEELTHYLELITGADFEVVRESDMQIKNPCIFIGQTEYAAKQGIELSELGSEEWIVRTVGSNLIITGGHPRGTLYGTYHFLEDVLGVHWWNPWGDEHVPSGLTINVGKLDMRGKPVFVYRDIFMLYGYDRGRFAARNRVNREGERLILPEYGGGPNYGFPDHAHTFSFYIPPEKYFKEHPDWFAFMEGRRTAEDNYLCLSNPELQQVFFDKLIEYIRLSFRNAERQGFERPMIFDLSQSEYSGHCTCERCKAMAEKYGSEAGVLLDFINQIADKVKEKYPNLGFLISTLAYHETEKAPTGISPRDNVVIRLCDTTSNLIKPVTHPDNSVFRENILSWAPITKNLWIWDYAVTFESPNGLPMPSMHTYPADYRFYAENGVSGIFTEHEYPDIADMRDMKIWMMAK